MEIQTRRADGGTEIRVKTDSRVAIAVCSEDGEKIYLPEVDGDDSSYYVEEPEKLSKTEEGYAVLHKGEVEDIEVIG